MIDWLGLRLKVTVRVEVRVMDYGHWLVLLVRIIIHTFNISLLANDKIDHMPNEKVQWPPTDVD